ncbi:MAG: hypothetical protein RL213_816 [Bacteroidota bacterium]|jgi:uncharacterized membrane protein YfcA
MTFGYVILLFLFFSVAFLYSSVGHGGASGYIALMVLLGFSATVIRPAALWMNIAVSLVGTLQFYRAGHFKKELLTPFLLLSVPMAFIGAKVQLPVTVFNVLIGGCLLIATARLLFIRDDYSFTTRPLSLPFALFAGAFIGLISGMIGIGGGVLLSPLLVIGRWATMRQSAAVAAPFILVNSVVAVISGGWSVEGVSRLELSGWIISVLAGGLSGSYVGSFRFSPKPMKYVLAAVLIIAAAKLFTV